MVLNIDPNWGPVLQADDSGLHYSLAGGILPSNIYQLSAPSVLYSCLRP